MNVTFKDYLIEHPSFSHNNDNSLSDIIAEGRSVEISGHYRGTPDRIRGDQPGWSRNKLTVAIVRERVG